MKLYRTRTQAEYDWLAKELGKKGMTSYIPRHEQGGDIVVYADEKEDYLSYSDLDYAEKEYPNEPIIEVSDLMDTVDHDTLMQKVVERNNKPEAYTPPNTGDPWIDNLPESYFEMYEEAETDKYARHKEITDYMHKTYVSKNKDYGNSFERTHKEIGSRASLGRIADKFYRLQNIILNDEQLVEDETVKDTLIDMANYAIMFAMELEEEE